MSEKKPVKLDISAEAKELGIDPVDVIKRVLADPSSSRELSKAFNAKELSSREYQRRVHKILRETAIREKSVRRDDFAPSWMSIIHSIFSYGRFLFFSSRSIIPAKPKLADAILLLFCSADDAEAATGDLLEELEKVQSRHGKWYCNFWFVWELSLLVILKGRKKLTKSVLGPLVDLWKRKSS